VWSPRPRGSVGFTGTSWPTDRSAVRASNNTINDNKDAFGFLIQLLRSVGHYFKSTSNITTGVFALMECFKFAGMWTQVPA
jgi:hypothetical protein